MDTNYKFNSENEYQLWCQNKINGIYYSNIAMNNEKIKEHVQDIARTLHCSEGEHLVKPEPLVFVIYYSKGMYDDWSDSTIPFTYNGTLNELIAEITEKQEIFVNGYAKLRNITDYKKRDEKENELEAKCIISGVNCEFSAAVLYDVYEDSKKAYFKVQRLEEWIAESHHV